MDNRGKKERYNQRNQAVCQLQLQMNLVQLRVASFSFHNLLRVTIRGSYNTIVIVVIVSECALENTTIFTCESSSCDNSGGEQKDIFEFVTKTLRDAYRASYCRAIDHRRLIRRYT
jgi:hypothetical protein